MVRAEETNTQDKSLGVLVSSLPRRPSDHTRLRKTATKGSGENKTQLEIIGHGTRFQDDDDEGGLKAGLCVSSASRDVGH
jgi:hypothetical protein